MGKKTDKTIKALATVGTVLVAVTRILGKK
mgnify:FL=1